MPYPKTKAAAEKMVLGANGTKVPHYPVEYNNNALIQNGPRLSLFSMFNYIEKVQSPFTNTQFNYKLKQLSHFLPLIKLFSIFSSHVGS